MTRSISAHKPAGEEFLQALFCQVITRGDASHRLRIAKPLSPLDRERRLNRMNNEHLLDAEIGSFDENILPHLDAAHNFARWLVRNSDDAEDVVQEACLRAFRYYGTSGAGMRVPGYSELFALPLSVGCRRTVDDNSRPSSMKKYIVAEVKTSIPKPCCSNAR